MKTCLFIILTLFSISAYAALPPFYQSKKEIEIILNDKRLVDELTSAEMIVKIKRIEDSYLISTDKYTLKVEVIYLPTDQMGPAQFKLKFHEKQPKYF